MALTSAERASCRTYLGYPGFQRYLNFRLEGALSLVDQDADVETQVRAQLVNIAAVDTELQQVVGGVKKVDDVEFFAHSAQLNDVRSKGRTYIGRLSTILGCPIYADYFSAKGYPGDKFSAGGLANSRATNIIPLG